MLVLLSLLLGAASATTIRLSMMPTLFRDALLPGERGRIAIHDQDERALLEGSDMVGQLLLRRDGHRSTVVPTLVVDSINVDSDTPHAIVTCIGRTSPTQGLGPEGTEGYACAEGLRKEFCELKI